MSASSDGSVAVATSGAPVSLFSSAAHCRSAQHFLSSVSPRCSLSAAPRLFYPSLLLADPTRPSDVAIQFLHSIALESPFKTDPAYHLRALRRFYASRVDQLQRAAVRNGVDTSQRQSEAGQSDSVGSVDTATQQRLMRQATADWTAAQSSSPFVDSLHLPQPPSLESLSGLLVASSAAAFAPATRGAGAGSELLTAAGRSSQASSLLESVLSAPQPAFVLPHHPSLQSSSADSLGVDSHSSAAWLAARLPSAASIALSESALVIPLPLAPPSAAPSAASSTASSALATALSFRRTRTFPATVGGPTGALLNSEQPTDDSQPQADNDDHLQLHLTHSSHSITAVDHAVQRSHGALITGRSIASNSEQWEREAVSKLTLHHGRLIG